MELLPNLPDEPPLQDMGYLYAVTQDDLDVIKMAVDECFRDEDILPQHLQRHVNLEGWYGKYGGSMNKHLPSRGEMKPALTDAMIRERAKRKEFEVHVTPEGRFVNPSEGEGPSERLFGWHNFGAVNEKRPSPKKEEAWMNPWLHNLAPTVPVPAAPDISYPEIPDPAAPVV